MTSALSDRDVQTSTPPSTPGLSPPRQRRLGYFLLAALAYIPVLLAHPGRVVADTKQYLYLDPSRVLERAWSMWDGNIGLGTVTHQNIGYLFPMGPYYWTMERLGVPDWVAQRIWLASIVFTAGLGMLYLFRTIGLRGAGAPVGALVFMLSPYWLEYAARLSVLLLPWAGLPWMLALVIRGIRRGGWRHAALFALLIQVIGSVNLTALVFAGLAPLLWIPYALFVDREANWRRVLGLVAKIGLLTLVASAWWMSGLWAQGGYGLNILKYTETMRVVSRTTMPNEVLRGLGYWFFYGRDRLGPWIEASTGYTQRPALILISYAIPTLAFLSAALVRWRHRAYFMLLLVAGAVVAVGAHPYDSPTPLGAAFKKLSQTSSVAFALRSTGRAVPLVVLGLAGLIAAGVTGATTWVRASRRPRFALGVPLLVGGLVFLNLPALWTGGFYGDNLQRPEEIPQYWKNAAKYLDAAGPDTRVLEIPGSDFGSYRWGQTVDPITPGIIDRPYVAREVIPYGSPASANLVNAFDLRLQDRKLTPDSIAPLARLMGVGAITLRNDIQFERYRLLRPQFTSVLFTPTPTGLRPPQSFGTPTSTQSTEFPFLDEQALLANPNLPVPAPVTVFDVQRPAAIIRSAPQAGPIVMAGDGEGMVDAAQAGLLDGRPIVLYSGSYAKDAKGLRRQIAHDATLVVTDSNRDRGRRWSSLTETAGFTEGPGSHPLTKDESDSRLDLFPNQPQDAQTVTVLQGARSIRADNYGNSISYTPEDRPSRAFDGDPLTAWRTGQFDEVKGDRIRIVLDHPITTDHVNLVQVLRPPNERYITDATVRFDGAHDTPITLGKSSRTTTGQTVRFPRQTFQTFEIEIRGTNFGEQIMFGGLSPVGFGEIRLSDDAAGSAPVVVHEVIRMPGDLLRVAGAASASRPLLLLMNRDRVLPVPARHDPEVALTRAFTLPSARSFAVAGDVRISRDRRDDEIDRTLGYSGPVVARSSARLVDAPAVRASAALDHDPTTAWVTPFKEAVGSQLHVGFGSRRTVDHLDLALVADERHSVPTKLVIRNGEGERRVVTLTVPVDQAVPNGTVATTAAFAPLTGDRLDIRIAKVRPVLTREYDCGCDVQTPAAIAELGVPNLAAVIPPASMPSTCRTDLLVLDGQSVPAKLVGTTAAAVALQPLAIAPCGKQSTRVSVTLAAGPHVATSATGATSGVVIDRLVWSSTATGSPDAGVTAAGTVAVTPRGSGPTVQVIRTGRATATAEVTGASRPFWLVLGQSQNAGWHATVDGRDVGPSKLVDGFANGWLIRPHQRTVTVDLEWVPQRTVVRSIAVSILAVMLCLGIILGSSARSRRSRQVALLAPADAGIDIVAMSGAQGERRKAGIAATVVTALIVGVFGGIVVRPDVGVLLGLAVAGALRDARVRRALAFVPVVAIAGAGAYIALRQARYQLPPIFEWPTFFSRARTLGWIAIVVLGANAIIGLVLDRRRDPAD